MTTDRPALLQLDDLPGHYIRRLQQIAAAIFLDETSAYGITPVQYAALQAVHDHPRIDQRSLAQKIGFDTSTIGGVVDRLERRGLMQRNTSTDDRRVWLLTVTPDGDALLKDVYPAVLQAQLRMLEPLPEAERPRFMQLLKILVGPMDNNPTRAPDAE